MPATTTYDQSVLDQAALVPEVYGKVDFSIVPERLDHDATIDDERFTTIRKPVGRVFDRPELLERMRNYTMTGDRVADAYAALIPTLGLGTLIGQVEQACTEGVDAVEDAPQELRDLIASMEATPDWLDLDLVRKGAAEERVPMATATPFAIRGAFLATFLNKYAALPMTMTGALSNEAAVKRVFETASFFTATTMPGALDRHGKGFQAAAKVRLMHSMVRFHGEFQGSAHATGQNDRAARIHRPLELQACHATRLPRTNAITFMNACQSTGLRCSLRSPWSSNATGPRSHEK